MMKHNHPNPLASQSQGSESCQDLSDAESLNAKTGSDIYLKEQASPVQTPPEPPGIDPNPPAILSNSIPDAEASQQ